MLKINNLKIDTSLMSTDTTSRSFVVTGELGSKFTINVVQADTIKYYNWNTKTFELGHGGASNNLRGTINNGLSYRNNIVFPSGGGGYTIILIAGPGSAVDGSDNNVISKSIQKQAANATVTFIGDTATTLGFDTLPSTTSTGSLLDTNTIPFSWDITSELTDAGGFGLRVISTFSSIVDSFIYLEVTSTASVASPRLDSVEGIVSASTAVTLSSGTSILHINVGDYIYGVGIIGGTTVSAVDVGGDKKKITLSAIASIADGASVTFVAIEKTIAVDSTVDLSAGMELISIGSGGLIGAPFIKSVDHVAGTLAISSAQPVPDDAVLTFRAKGSVAIKSASGLNISLLGDVVVTPVSLTKTVRGNVSNDTVIPLNNTHGIGGGDIHYYKGLGVNNTSSNLITSVTPDPDGSDADGSIVVQLAQTLSAGTALNIKDTHSVINIAGNIIINSYPTTDKTVYLSLDDVMAVGVAS